MSLIGFKIHYDSFEQQVHSILLKNPENEADNINELTYDYIQDETYYQDFELFFPGGSDLRKRGLRVIVNDTYQIYIGYVLKDKTPINLDTINQTLSMFKNVCPLQYLEHTDPIHYHVNIDE